ncbi:MAG TPA: DUF1572 family protein [Candidatus Binatia bacterium]|nr:DUF1572 family protein [Candidatus Binatia bacterium]
MNEEAYLRDVVRTYRNYKALGEKALVQTPEAHWHTELDAASNSIAVIVKHVAGNLRSRFADFLTTDGEKPDRDRDGEFTMTGRASREEILGWWERGWATALGSIESLRPEDLGRTIHIRQEPFLVVEALNRSVTHTAYHVGQIVYLARHFAGAEWRSLTIPKGMSGSHQRGDFHEKGIARS